MTISQYRSAKLIREFEQLLLKLFAQGKLNGTVHTCVGQELIPVLLSTFIIPEDTFFSNHRGHGHYISKTGDIRGLLAEVMGKTTGCSGGYGGSQHLFQEGSFYSNGIQGGMAPIATGFAFSKKISKKKGISVLFLGDGTLGEGVLYEAFNCASVYKLPILFVLENNGYAQSTSSRQTFAGSTIKRFEGFGLRYFKGEIWKEDELLSNFESAVNAARDFQPAIIEIACYRLNAHSKGDDNRDENEVNEFSKKDPINKFEKQCQEQAVKIQREIDSFLSNTLKEVETEPILNKTLNPGKIIISETEFLPLNLPTEALRINECIYRAFRDEFEKDNRVVIFGEDVENSNIYNPKPYGGAFKVTRDLSNLFEHIYNTPISEAAITGLGIGIALESKSLATSEIMFGDFTTLVLDQILQHASKFQGMYGRKLTLPFLLRTPMGGKRGYGPTHSQSLEKHFLGIYGVNVLALNYRCNPIDFYGSVIRSINCPTMVVENKIDYTRYINEPLIQTHQYFISSEICPTIKITPKSINPQLTLFCYGGMLRDVELAIEELFIDHEIAVEVICPTSLFPLNIKPLQDSIRTTGRLLTVEEGSSFCGLGSEVIAQLIANNIELKRVKQLDNNSVIPSSFVAELNLLVDKNQIVDEIVKM